MSPWPLHANSSAHPIVRLTDQADHAFEELRSRQSRTLAEAVQEYRRRYGLHPPPQFDRWYRFAKKRNVELIDEFDTVHHALLPFWALKPSTIRARAREALGYDNALMGVTVRGGRVVLAQGGTEWQQEATVGMMRPFVGHLPDMDLAFNIHDEPRVMVPHDDLHRLVTAARDVHLPRAGAYVKPLNRFSPRPADVNDGMTVPEHRTTRFNRYAHQFVWLPSRLSCPPDSPSRSLDEDAPDDVARYLTADLGFVWNATAFSDVCLAPSLGETYGFFERPNAFNVAHDLFPIFSQSKVSSFQDILYPSPWYWFGKVPYQDDKDMPWEAKAERMYWRGSTTGGFSRGGGWRRQHRQHVVRRINALDTARVLRKPDQGDPAASWTAQDVPRVQHRALFDVKFSHVGQCDPDDCDAQREFFEIAEPAGQQEAWAFKYLLDMDGNAFSGRFYAFLKSRSLVYKLAIFREWHHDWLRPWVHYIPLSLGGDEYVESVRYFAQEGDGRARAPRIAEQGRDWAQRVLRNEDLEVWFFRLLLEYRFPPTLSLFFSKPFGATAANQVPEPGTAA